MKNMTFDTSLNRIKELTNYRIGPEHKPNISETVEYKVEAADGKTYGIVRECQRYFIKEQVSDGSFDYIGGIGNKSENEYPSYNSAFRNIELKVRSINEAKNSGIVVESFKPAPQAEYIVEATETMRTELDRVKQVMNGANKIMNEAKTEFITKPIFKDPEGFGQATDPKKQGEPFEDKKVEPELNRDNAKSSKTAKNAGTPFEDEVKPAPEKMDIETTTKKPYEAGKFGEPAKNVPANSVANQKPKGGKVVRVTEEQLQEARKMMKEWGEDEFFMDDAGDSGFGDDPYGENPLLKKFDYPEINKLGRGIAPVSATRPGEDLDLNLGDDIDVPEFSDEPLEMDVEEESMSMDRRFESFDKDNLVKEITEAVLKAFGDHPTYQKPAFTTPKANQEMLPGTHEWDDQSVKGEAPYGQKIGSSAPYTVAVKQKVGEGEIGADADDVMKGKTPQGLPTQGKKGDVSPFNKPVKKTGDKIAKGTPVQNGETQQGEPKLGQKGDTKPFEKKATHAPGVTTESKKEEALRKLTESIIRDLKKK